MHIYPQQWHAQRRPIGQMIRRLACQGGLRRCHQQTQRAPLLALPSKFLGGVDDLRCHVPAVLSASCHGEMPAAY